MSGLSSRRTVRDSLVTTVFNKTMIASENSSIIPVSNFKELVMYLVVTNAGGTSPTLDIKYQQRIGGIWVDYPALAFAQLAVNGTEYLDNAIATYGTLLPLGQNGRFVVTITGTTPTFDVRLDAIFKS